MISSHHYGEFELPKSLRPPTLHAVEHGVRTRLFIFYDDKYQIKDFYANVPGSTQIIDDNKVY